MKTNETQTKREKWRIATNANRARIRAEGGRQASFLFDAEVIHALEWLIDHAKTAVSEKSLIGSLILREFKRLQRGDRSK